MYKKTVLKNQLRRVLLLLVCGVISVLLVACENETQQPPNDLPDKKFENPKIYSQKGLEIAYPADWQLLHDEPGIIADRTVAFETPEVSRITVYFYKTSPRSYADLANSLADQLNLENSDSVKNYKRAPLEMAGFKGVRLVWLGSGLSETKNEVSIFKLRQDPYPVLVQFQLFDDDIEMQSSNIVPFLNSISFDPKGIEL